VECWGSARRRDQLQASRLVLGSGVGRLDLFGIGVDNALWHKAFDSNGWHNWQPIGGVLTSAPSAVSWAPNRIDVIARGF
jgi:hypothetical protein